MYAVHVIVTVYTRLEVTVVQGIYRVLHLGSPIPTTFGNTGISGIL